MEGKVIALLGSPRKKGTYQLLVSLRGLLEERGLSLEILQLSTLDIKPCKGCQKCILKGKCIYQDDMDTVLSALQSARAVILASPVYIGHITAQLKIFLDRTCAWYHRPPLSGIPFLSVITTAYSGIRETKKYLAKAGMDWGMIPAGSLIRNAGNLGHPVQAHELNRFFYLIRQDRSHYRPALGQLMAFAVQKVLALEVLSRDREYWVDKGWDRQDFFFQCRIGLLHKWISRLFFRILSRNVRRTRQEAESEGGVW